MAKELFIPKLGQTVEEVRLVHWLVPDGAKVEQGDGVLEVETDKAIFTVESPARGYIHIGPFKEDLVLPVLTVVATVGKADEQFAPAQISEGSEIAEVSTTATQPTSGATAAQTPEAEAPHRTFASPRARKLAEEENVDLSKVTPTGGGGQRVAERDVVAYLQSVPRATPVAERIAAEAGIDLRSVTGTGSGGTITKEDVQQAVEQKSKRAKELEKKAEQEKVSAPTLPSVPVPTPSRAAVPLPTPVPLPPAEVAERIPLKGIRALISERMGTSAHTTARVTLFMDVDATEFAALRERLKVKVSEQWGFTPAYNDLLVRIVAVALRKFPYMNARIAPDAIEYLSRIDVGLAVDTERGLVVPVVRNADQKSVRQIGAEYRELAERARMGRSKPDDFGGTFTVTSLGALDVDGFTPIINLPEAAILGIGRIAARPVVYNGEITARKMMTLSLAFDHRVTDGAPAARFMKYVKELVEEPYLLLAE